MRTRRTIAAVRGLTLRRVGRVFETHLSRQERLLLVLVVLILGAALWVKPIRAEEAAPLGRLDYVPYRVAVSVSFAPDPTLTAAFRRSVVAGLASRIDQTFGAAWQVVPSDGVREDDRLTPADETGLERLTYAAAAELLGKTICDKAYFLVVWSEGPQWRIAGREWDRTVQTIGPVAAAQTPDRRAIADSAVALLQRLFSPLSVVDDADPKSNVVTLTVRAGSIPMADPRFAPLSAGDVLLPVFRFLDAKREVRKILPVPWTYLVLESVNKGRATAAVASSYRAPLGANMRRRVEAIAVRLRPEFPATRLKLVVGKNPPLPAAGLFVSFEPSASDKNVPTRPSPDETAPPDVQKLMSDRRGVVTIPAEARHPLGRIEVRSGSVLLARRSFVPGVDSEVTLEVPDDSLRLSTEREIDLLCGRLIETVAQRAAVIGRTRAAVKRNDEASARQLLDELQHLPVAETYLGEVNKIRVLALDDAARRKDRLAERRIEDLCQKTRQLVEQYLPDDRIALVKEEVNDLLESGKPDPAVKRPTKGKRVVRPKKKATAPTAPSHPPQSAGGAAGL